MDALYDLRDGFIPDVHQDSSIVSGLLLAGAVGYGIDRVAETYLPADIVNGTTPRWSLLVSVAWCVCGCGGLAWRGLSVYSSDSR